MVLQHLWAVLQKEPLAQCKLRESFLLCLTVVPISLEGHAMYCVACWQCLGTAQLERRQLARLLG
jgi:hypothetical protein